MLKLLNFSCSRCLFPSDHSDHFLVNINTECKHSSFESVIENGRGVACFYLNLDDVEAHRRVVAFMLEHGLVRKTKSGKLYNIGFKLDDQARAGEYGAGFKARITLSDRSN